MRIKLKSSKSYPNELLNQQFEQNAEKNDEKPPSKILTKDTLSANHDECDNSSSGVSSDQEVTASNVKTIAKTPSNSNMIISTNSIENKHGILKTSSMPKNAITTHAHAHAHALTNTSATSVKIVESINKKSINLPPLSNVTKKISAAVSETPVANDDFDDFEDLPAKGFQRQVSLTRKQAASIAVNRNMYTRSAVSLAQLPPPLEGDSDDPDHQQSHCQTECRKNNIKVRKIKPKRPVCFSSK